ncbi:hypothetical protein HPB52_000493 [Rhipicephalus sanguineus]|uniref:Uncharacterized protein n=1 Tax=Rhipicephalus sanguineus TaxID=34632 RepID=A0A9D4PAT1_RHISA|nr:hypothetical protein HPB52_000493 [Rhipicephalus sanguineus]
MNVNTPYAIADARQMGHSKSILITFVATLPSSIVFNCGVYRCHPFRPKAEACTNCWTPGHRADVCIKPKSALCCRCGQAHNTVEPPTCVPCCILCKEAHLTGSHPCKLRFDRTGPSPSTHSKPQPPPPAPPTGPILKSSRPSRPRRRSTSRGARSTSRHGSPHTSDSKIAALEATIAAQQLQIQELSLQLQAALAPEESMNTAPSAASSRASSPTRRPPHKRRSPSSDAIAPHERDVVRETASFLEASASSLSTRAWPPSNPTLLDTRVAALEARQSATEATLAHLSLPAPLTLAPTPTPPVELSGVPRQAEHPAAPPPGYPPPDTIPSILALQEPLAPVKLRDYTSFHPSSEAHPNVATLVHRNLTAVLHQLNIVDWDRFRSIRLTHSSSSVITDLSAWTERSVIADPFGGRPHCHIHNPCSAPLLYGRQPSAAPLGGLSRCPPPVADPEAQSPSTPPFGSARVGNGGALLLSSTTTVGSDLRPYGWQPGPPLHVVASQVPGGSPGPLPLYRPPYSSSRLHWLPQPRP